MLAALSTLLAQVKSAGATRLVLQLEEGTVAERFAVIVRKDGMAEALRASTLLASP